jgi:hypothetical protein
MACQDPALLELNNGGIAVFIFRLNRRFCGWDRNEAQPIYKIYHPAAIERLQK